MGAEVTPAAQITAANLRVDAVTAEVLRGFETEGVQSVLLKGVSVSRWISTAEHPRRYLDTDLLVRPADAERAEDVLRGLGFSPLFDEHEMPGWWREHSMTWMRSTDEAKVDLHRTLEGVGVEPEQLWLILSGHAESIEVGGHRARTLTIPARAFHLALHTAQHGAEWDRPLTDLGRALDIAGEETWREAAEIAASLDATAPFAVGLRLLPAGRAIADRLELPTDLPTDVALRAGTPPPVALGLDQLAQAKGLRARLAILRHKLFPPPSFMRHWSPRARRGRLGLLLAYLWRPFWLLARLPAGFRAWRDARRAAQRGGSGST